MSEAAAIVRPLAAGDEAVVAGLDRAVRGEDRTGYWKERLGRFLDGGVGLVATVDGRPAGYLLGEVRDGDFDMPALGWIVHLGVDPALRRRGVGAALVRAAVDAFRKAGVGSVRTLVHLGDLEAVHFFHGCEFRQADYLSLELDL